MFLFQPVLFLISGPPLFLIICYQKGDANEPKIGAIFNTN